MTTDGLTGEALVAEILAACDRLLGEIGRRRHMFGWLRVPGGELDQWLQVDAYYPSNRVVVLCSESPHDSLCAELIPAHGMRLLRVDPDGVVDAAGGITAALETLIEGLAPVVHQPGHVPARREPRQSAVAAAFTSLTRPRERPPIGRRTRNKPLEREHSEQVVAAGLLVGIALVALLCFEVGLAVLALGAGHLLLAFGVAIDACSRVLGTVAAERAGGPGWVWPSVIGGSPVVATFALFQRSGPVTVEPAPLGGLLSLLAIALVLLALVIPALGI